MLIDNYLKSNLQLFSFKTRKLSAFFCISQSNRLFWRRPKGGQGRRVKWLPCPSEGKDSPMELKGFRYGQCEKTAMSKWRSFYFQFHEPHCSIYSRLQSTEEGSNADTDLKTLPVRSWEEGITLLWRKMDSCTEDAGHMLTEGLSEPPQGSCWLWIHYLQRRPCSLWLRVTWQAVLSIAPGSLRPSCTPEPETCPGLNETTCTSSFSHEVKQDVIFIFSPNFTNQFHPQIINHLGLFGNI